MARPKQRKPTKHAPKRPPKSAPSPLQLDLTVAIAWSVADRRVALRFSAPTEQVLFDAPAAAALARNLLHTAESVMAGKAPDTAARPTDKPAGPTPRKVAP